MNSQWAAARRVEEGVANAGAQENKVLRLEEAFMKHQIPIASPPMGDGDIRADFMQIDQVITTQAPSITTQPQELMAQAI